MAVEMKATGMEDVSRMLETLETGAESAAKRGLYKGAGIMADAITERTKKIRTAPFKWAGKGETRMPSPEEKAVVERARVGIAKFDAAGAEVNTAVGYSDVGYTKMVGKRSVPIAKIANAINSGTSFMQKQPFFRNAVNAAKEKASAAIAAEIEAAVNEITGGSET